MRLLLVAPFLMCTMQACDGHDPGGFTLNAVGHDSRIDLRWEPSHEDDLVGYFVYRSASAGGPFLKRNVRPHEMHVYSDFIGENGKTFYYRIGKAFAGRTEVEELSTTISASTVAMNDEQLLTSVQEATFRYFWDHAHPVSGLAYERGRTGAAPWEGQISSLHQRRNRFRVDGDHDRCGTRFHLARTSR